MHIDEAVATDLRIKLIHEIIHQGLSLDKSRSRVKAVLREHVDAQQRPKPPDLSQRLSSIPKQLKQAKVWEDAQKRQKLERLLISRNLMSLRQVQCLEQRLDAIMLSYRLFESLAMPSPFPGMDPYLEGYLWVDVHNALANKIRQQLVPKLRPRYTARLEIYLVEDTAPEGEIGILYPDVEVLRALPTDGSSSAAAEAPTVASGRAVLVTPAPLTLPLLLPVDIRIATVEIRDTAHNTLVACIEILSSVNKREPGLTPYRQKRQRLYNANVHLIEIDLLRRGTRPFNHPRLPDAAYLVTVTRAQVGTVDVWPLGLQEPLPTVPVPLQSPDADVPLHLQEALTAIYDEAAYDLSLDYRQLPPPPPLSQPDCQWLDELLTPIRGLA